MKGSSTFPRGFIAKMEPYMTGRGDVGFRTLYYTGANPGDPWSEKREEAKEMSLQEADRVAPTVGGAVGIVDESISVTQALIRESSARLARQGLD